MKDLKKEVTKEELNEFPVSRYEGEVKLIDQKDDIHKVIDEIRNQSILGFDTETKPSFKKGVIHKVSLVQIATYQCVYLFRIHKTGFPKELRAILESTEIIKVGIAIKDDLRDLKKIKEFDPKSVLDLNDIASDLGYASIGAKKLSALLLGFRISKRQQTSNWEAKILSAPQINYAATDAWICLHIYERMQKYYDI